MPAGYTVLANRYRPRTFVDVVGQEDAARVLQRSIESGRAPHAWLFSGPRGVGKTSMARILAKALDCLESADGRPCGACRVCCGIDETGDALDVVEIDGASHNKVENVRELIENLRFRPAEARYRIYIVDEVHMLSTSAFNALLKTLEEPPAHAKFILCTTEPLKVPETIRSRCQQFDFRRLTAVQIRDRLAWICEQESVPVPPGLLESVARDAQGGLRDALSLLDQLISFGDGKPTREDYERLTGKLSPEVLHGLLGATLDGDTAVALAAAEQALQRGARAADLLAQLTESLEGVLVVAAGGRPGDRADDELASLTELAERTDVDHVMAMLDVLVEASRRLKQRHDARLVVEMAVLTLARLPQLQPLADLLAGLPAEGPPATAARTPAPHAAPAPPPAAAPGPLPAAALASTPAGDFGERLLAELGRQRSLRMDLSRYRRIELRGDELLLLPPDGGPAGLYVVDRAAFTEAVERAASSLAGRRLRLRLLDDDAGSAAATGAGRASGAASDAASDGGAQPDPDGASAPRPSSGGPAGSSPLERDIRDAWPGAERVDM